MDIHADRFNNINEFLNTCDSRDYNEWARHRRDEYDNKSWQGDSYSAARDYLLHGDNRYTNQLKPRTLPQVTDIKPRDYNAVVGYSPIVPAAVMNIPTCMINRQNTTAKNKVLHIVYDCDASCDVNKRQMIEQGKKVAAFILSVERAGYRVQLDVFASFQQRGDDNGYAFTLTLKDAARPLDIKRLTYPLIHISMLRALAFDWFERYPHADYVCGYGLPLYHESKEYRDDFVHKVTHDNTATYITLTTDIDRLYEELTARQ